jgi:hypothetical protein
MRSLQMINACTNARRWLPATACALLFAGLSACGGGGAMTTSASPPAATASGCSASTCGSAVMTITDAAGDFLSYKVNLVSLQLQKADGTLVETLPVTTAVDFVQLISLSEVISTRQIPPGNYVAAQVTVDFTNASIMVDDGTGTGVAVKPVDSTGAALGQLALTVQLDNSNNLKITAAKASRIGFDFNLLASNMVNMTTKTVTVSPVLEASVVPVDHKQVRVRGDITAVDTANNDYTVSVDPFNDHDANDDNNNGGSGGNGNDANDNDKVLPLMVHTTSTTTFEINGAPFSGAAGLAQLATLPANTISVAFGSLSATDQSFTATSVLAGTSVSGGNLDHVQGSVVARVGNILTIHGARMDDRDGNDDDHFMPGNTTVTIAAATAVTEQGQASATPVHSIAEISVGSLVDAFGTASTDSSTGKVTLDATAGRVRLDLTHIQGALAASATGKITLGLTSIDRQPISLFNFTGTGSASGVDTKPTQYVVTTGALSLTPFTVGGSVLGIGFVNSFGTTPPDFTAVTLANGIMGDDNDDNDNDGNDNDNNGDNNNGDNNSGKGAQMDIDWGNSGTTTPFKALSATDLDLDVANSSIGSKHRIQVDPQDVDIEQLSSDVMIVGATSGMTLFAITGQHGRMTQNFQSFADFEKALAADLDGTTTALRLTAQGQYDATTNTFTAQRITILLSK